MNILGFHHGGDSNLCIIDTEKDDIYHLEEERISRIKHGSRHEIDKNFAKIINKSGYDIKSAVVSNIQVFKQMFYGADVEASINYTFNDNKYIIYRDDKKIYLLSHHLAHSAYAYYTRPLYMKNCDILSYDGWGYETDRYFYDSNLKLIDKSISGIGLAWKVLSYNIFGGGKHEGKLMGLSARGNVNHKLYESIHMFIERLKDMENFEESKRKKVRKEFTEVDFLKIHEVKKEDVAKTIQVFSENEILKYLNNNKTSENILISGGVALNGYINQMLVNKGIYKNVYVPPACSDSGLSIGAALFAANKFRNFHPVNVAYLGNEFNVEEYIKEEEYKKLSDNELYDYISDKIIEGKIIGWYQGQSESGPRALGNRSILCDPQTEKMKDHLNKQVKHREWFRPFAPAILHEHVHEWFENIEKEEPYMLKIAKYKQGMGEKVAAVCHVDYTGRVQTVTKESNNRFYNLIYNFYEKTNIPILLNTSFNDQEPIIDSPKDALKTFYNTNIDVLVLHNYIIEK